MAVMFRIYAALMCLCCIVASFTAYADEKETLRKAFLAAEKRAWNVNSPEFKRLYKKIADYPLKPYIDLKVLRKNINANSQENIEKFLKKHQGTPLDWPLRKKWLQYLAKKKKKKLFIKYFKPTNDVRLTCKYLRYQLDEKVPAKQVLPKVTKLWLVGKSQPKVCDPLFKKWQQAGYRTKDIIWQRVALAADGGKYSLIPYLAKLLPKDEQYLAQQWYKVRRNPAYVKHVVANKKHKIKTAAISYYGLKRLIWRKPKQAINLYAKVKKLKLLTDKQINKLTASYAIALASKNHKEAKKWLSKVKGPYFNNKLSQWFITHLLREQNWPKIKQELVKIPKMKQQTSQWQYWYARSLLATNEKEKGTKILNTLAGKRHYYGFLAARYLKKPTQFNHKPLQYNAQEQAKVMQASAAQRAFELFAVKHYHQARKEWNYWLSTLSKQEKFIAVTVAYEKKWFDRGIFTLAKEGYFNDVDIRFPLGFSSEISKQAKYNKINAAWAFAIARRESSFMVDASSPVGARGLMQIMPATAKQLDRKKSKSHNLFSARYNIKLGTKYLKNLMKKYKNNQILATAAYNAGPSRVKQWLKASKPLPADIWIETIPFHETREYVKSVLAYQQIYQAKLNISESMFDTLLTMKI